MAKPNYQFEKRQRELEKKKAKAEKALKKSQASEESVATTDHTKETGIDTPTE